MGRSHSICYSSDRRDPENGRRAGEEEATEAEGVDYTRLENDSTGMIAFLAYMQFCAHKLILTIRRCGGQSCRHDLRKKTYNQGPFAVCESVNEYADEGTEDHHCESED